MAREPQIHLEGGVKRKRNHKAIEPEEWATQVKTCPFCSFQEAQFKYLNNKKRDQPRYKCLRVSCGKLFSPHMIRPKRFLQGYNKSSQKELLVEDMSVTQNQQVLQGADTGERLLHAIEPEEWATQVKTCPFCSSKEAQFKYLSNKKRDQPRYKCLRVSCGKLFSPHMIRPKRFLQGYNKSSQKELLVDDMSVTQNQQVLQDADTGERLHHAIEPEEWATQVKTCPFCSSKEAQFKYLKPRYKCLGVSCGKLFSPHMIRPKRFLQGYNKSSQKELLVDDMSVTQNQQVLQDADTGERLLHAIEPEEWATQVKTCPFCSSKEAQFKYLSNKKRDQPRYKCLGVSFGKLFSPHMIRPKRFLQGYNKSSQKELLVDDMSVTQNQQVLQDTDTGERLRHAIEPEEWATQVKTCPFCSCKEAQFKYLNNKKRDQPRYKCLRVSCRKLFSPHMIRPKRFLQGYNKSSQKELLVEDMSGTQNQQVLQGADTGERLLHAIEPEEWATQVKTCPFCSSKEAQFKYLNNKERDQPRYKCLRVSCGKLFSPHMIRPKRFFQGYNKSSQKELLVDDMSVTQNQQVLQDADTAGPSETLSQVKLPLCDRLEEEISSRNRNDVPSPKETGGSIAASSMMPPLEGPCLGPTCKPDLANCAREPEE